MEYPDDLKYTPDHEWVRFNTEEEMEVGITAFAADALGDIVYLDIMPVGTVLAAGNVFGTIEAVKTVSDLYVPISGKITAVNPSLNARPELVNQTPYSDGWLIRITPVDQTELQGLLTANTYRLLVTGA